jgi:DNA replication protein DnaC
MNEQLFQKALLSVQSRRSQAVSENERRHREINEKIPQIAEINSGLAQTAGRLFTLMRDGKANEGAIEQLRRENLEAQSICSQLLTSNGYPADYLEIHYHCEKCNDTGYYQGRYCPCLEQAIAAEAIRNMNRSAQLTLASFDQFSLEYYRGRTADGEDCYAMMRRILSACQSYAANFSTASPSLLFYGGTGLGKTHLSLAIAHDVMVKGFDVIYDSIINLLDKVESEHFGRSKDSDADTLHLLLSVDLLILDDLGTEYTSPFYVSTIYNIINTRINRGLPTIISTNLDFIGIQRRYEERLVSRLFTMYEALHFIGEDVRLLKKAASKPLV